MIKLLTGDDVTEIEANTFAAELLMPKKLLERDLRENLDDIDLGDDASVGRLANRYKVSISAMTFRLTNLGSISR